MSLSKQDSSSAGILVVGLQIRELAWFEQFLASIPEDAALTVLGCFPGTTSEELTLSLGKLGTEVPFPVYVLQDQIRVRVREVVLVPLAASVLYSEGFLTIQSGTQATRIMRSFDLLLSQLAASLSRQSAVILLQGVQNEGVRGAEAVFHAGGQAFLQLDSTDKFETPDEQVTSQQSISQKLWQQFSLGEALPVETVLDRLRPLGARSLVSMMMESLPELFVYLDEQGLFLLANRMWEDWFDKPQSDWVDHPFDQFFPVDDRPRVGAYLKRSLKGETLVFPLRLPCSHGRTKEVEVKFLPHGAKDRQVLGLCVLMRDVTQQNEVERLTKIRYERYRSLLKMSTSVIWTWNAEGRFITQQQSWEDYTGQAWHDYQGFGWVQAVHHDDRSMFLEGLREAREELSLMEVEGRVWNLLEGEYRFCIARIAPLLTEGFQVKEWVGTLTDIHDHYLAELKIRELSTQLERILDSLTEGIYGVDVQGNTIFCNPAASRMLNCNDDEGVPYRETIPAIYSDAALTPMTHPIAKTLLSGKPQQARGAILERKDGIRFAVDLKCIPLRGEEETLLGAVLSFNDITLQQETTHKLEQHEESLNLALAAGTIGTWSWNTTSNQMYWDERSHLIFGEPDLQAPVPYDTFLQYVHPEDQELVTETVQKTIEEQVRYELEYRIVQPNQTVRHIAVRASAINDPADQSLWVMGVCHDITDRKQAQAEFERYAKELERSNFDLQQFAYVASHDLQEPLRAISSYCQLLVSNYKANLDERGVRWLGYTSEAASRLQDLVKDLLAYSRVDRHANPMDVTDLDQVVDVVLLNLEESIEENEAEIEREPLPEVMGDHSQLVQVFQNLIGNAIKFRTERTPKIQIWAEDTGEHWIISIEDNGIGIKPDYHERIFEIFRRLKTQSEYAGTGLGLAICKRMIERHNGEIWVESQENHGSTFRFTLPKPSTLLLESDTNS